MFIEQKNKINQYIEEQFEEYRLKIITDAGYPISSVKLKELTRDFMITKEKTETADILWFHLSIGEEQFEDIFTYEMYFSNNPFETTTDGRMYWPEESDAYLTSEEGLMVEYYPLRENITDENRIRHALGDFLEDIDLSSFIENNAIRDEMLGVWKQKEREEIAQDIVDLFPFIHTFHLDGYGSITVTYENGAVFKHDLNHFEEQLEIVKRKQNKSGE